MNEHDDGDAFRCINHQLHQTLLFFAFITKACINYNYGCTIFIRWGILYYQKSADN